MPDSPNWRSATMGEQCQGCGNDLPESETGVYDGDPLSCGCGGGWSVDESGAFPNHDDEGCTQCAWLEGYDVGNRQGTHDTKMSIAAWLRGHNIELLRLCAGVEEVLPVDGDVMELLAAAIERGDWRAKPDCPECGSTPHKLSCSTGGAKAGRLTMPVSAPEPDDHRKDEDE